MESSVRLKSLDALRGFDMLWIMGGGAFVLAICRALGWGEGAFLFDQMHHAEWSGFRFMDTVFPLFLFIAGVSYPYSCARRAASGADRTSLALGALRRGLTLVLLGLVYQNLLQFDFAHLRVWSVLGRIGIAWMAAAWLYLLFGLRARLCLAGVILAGTWLFFCLVAAPDAPAGADPFSPEGNFGCWLDRTLTAGHTYMPNFDPEGFAGLLPSVVTAMLGMFAGEWIRREDVSGGVRAAGLLAAACALAAAAGLVSLFCPVNKALWSSSFVLAAGAYSFFVLSVFYWVVDVKGWQKWTFFFRVIGMNSIAIYMAQRFVAFRRVSEFFLGGVAGQFPPGWGEVVLEAGYVGACWLTLLFLYRKKAFFKV